MLPYARRGLKPLKGEKIMLEINCKNNVDVVVKLCRSGQSYIVKDFSRDAEKLYRCLAENLPPTTLQRLYHILKQEQENG